jgi:hypothetical protein
LTTSEVAGDPNVLDREVLRLRELRDRLDRMGDAIRGMQISQWEGLAREAFEAFRGRYWKRLYEVADLHATAADQLDQYRQVLVEVRGRQATADPVSAVAADDLARWQGQLRDQAAATAAAMLRVATALDALPPLLPTPGPDSDPGPAVAVPAAAMASTPKGLGGLDIAPLNETLARLQADVDDLRAQIVAAKLVVAGP